MTPEQAAALRAEFPAEKVGKLPRVTCGQCRDEKRAKHCSDHDRQRCDECQNYITTAHIHLDYVGHADVTDRLLSVDPEWTWEPLALGDDGLPALDQYHGMWIRLTVAGVTRLGYGDAGGKAGPDAVKEAIGDALRNASMRFGVALDLWSKSREEQSRDPAGYRRPSRQTRPDAGPEPTEEQAVEYERLRRLILATETDEALSTAGQQAHGSLQTGGILAEQYDRLREIGARRKAAIERRTQTAPAEAAS